MSRATVGDQPTPIGAVVNELRHEFPDVSHSSLRFLERERLVVPTRTPGGHRLYTPADIARIRLIKTWQAQRASLADVRARLERLDGYAAPDATPALAAQFLERVLSGELSAARRAVLDARDAGLALDVLCDDVLRPALTALGAGWERGEIAVAQEKEASALTRDLIAELAAPPVATTPSAEASGTVVAACVMGEQHELGICMVAAALRARGAATHYLGAAVAPEFLVDAVRRRAPRAVLLSATLDERLPALRDAIGAVRASGRETDIWAGGQAVQRHAALVASWGATAYEADSAGVDALLDALRAPEMGA